MSRLAVLLIVTVMQMHKLATFGCASCNTTPFLSLQSHLSQNPRLNLLDLSRDFSPHFLLRLSLLITRIERRQDVAIDPCQALSNFALQSKTEWLAYPLVCPALIITPWDSGPAVVACTKFLLPSSAVHARTYLTSTTAMAATPSAWRVSSV